MKASVGFLCVCLVLSATFLGKANAQLLNLTQWTVAAGGNDHWYGLLTERLHWGEALEVVSGYQGYLATAVSQSENEFIYSSVVAGVDYNDYNEFWLGGERVSGVWTWHTGEAWEYTNWGPGEPNHPHPEDKVAIRGDFMSGSWPRPPDSWNNLPGRSMRYWSVVEFGPSGPHEENPIPEPSTALLLVPAVAAFAVWRMRR